MPRSQSLPVPCVEALEEALEPAFFQALCDPARIALVAHLAASGRTVTVTEASECCGLHLSGVSRHLAILRRAGLVRAEKRGREVHYELGVPELVSTLRTIADGLEACWADASQ